MAGVLNLPRAGIDAALPVSARREAAAAREGIALLGVMALAFALRLHLLGLRPLWLDEAYSLGVAARSFRGILEFLRVADAHPVGYYAFLSVWIRWFGTGLAEARFPSLVFGMAAVFLTWRIGRQLFSPAAGIIAAALVALNPFQIIAANEIRMYPLLECLALISTWILWRAGAQGPAARWWWIAYGLSAAAMAYTSYYSFVLVSAQGLWALLSQRPRRQALANIALAAAVALLCYVPWLPYVLAVPARGVPWRQPFEPGYVLGVAAAQTYGGYLFGAGNYHEFAIGIPLRCAVPLVLPFVALLAAGAVLLARDLRPAARLIGYSWACPVLLILLGSIALRRVEAYPRHLVFLEPFAALLLAGGIVWLWRCVAAAPAAQVVRVLTICVLVGAFGYPAVAQFNPALQHYRYDLAAELVASRYAAGDTIVYFPAGTELAFRYYFSPPGPQIRVLGDRTRWTRNAFQPAIHAAAEAVADAGSRRVWLVYSLPWPRGSLNDLVEALGAKHYRPGPSWDFHAVWVTLLSK